MGGGDVDIGVVTFLKKLQSSTQSLTKYYTDKTKIGYKILMYFASYSFFLQFFVGMIYASMASSLFGERGILLAVRNKDSSFWVIVES